MSSCEKCWADAGGDSNRYRELLRARDKTGRCTPEEEAGPNAKECPLCHRRTKHQHTGQLMCGCALKC